MTGAQEGRVTETGGRKATTRLIPPKLALAVGMPLTQPPNGWKWKPLSSLARLESGHTPSRRHPEYWGGNIPWIGIADAKLYNGRRITGTLEKTNELGIANSSARVLPENTVCLSRTASVGYVVVMGRPMATSQDFVNWVCTKDLDHNFLKYLLIAEGDDLLRFASGSVHSTIYFPEVKAFHVCLPELEEQRRIVGILDEALEAIAIAKAHSEKNRENTRVLFESYLESVFARPSPGRLERPIGALCEIKHGFAFDGADFGSDVPDGNPLVITPGNFTEDGKLVFNEKNTKRFSGNVPVGFSFEVGDLVVVMTDLSSKMKILGKPAFVDTANVLHNQRIGRVLFLNDQIDKRLLYYFMMSASFLRNIKSSATGTMVKHTAPKRILSNLISFPKARDEQEVIVRQLDDIRSQTQRLTSVYQHKHTALEALKVSLLHEAFSGGLTKRSRQSVVVPFPTKALGITTTDLHAGILAAAYDLHENNNLQRHFGHVKAEKVAHMVEALSGIDLGRSPMKDAAGPNDYPHLLNVEHRARKAGFFDFKRVDGAGYQVKKLRHFDALITRVREKVGDQTQTIDDVLELMLPMTTQQAEIFCTVYAAWNNLLLDGKNPTDEEVVMEARENWHPAKLNIPRQKFFGAIEWLREKNMVPSGEGKRVSAKTKK
jgi:type I restriction enzyme S subunit